MTLVNRLLLLATGAALIALGGGGLLRGLGVWSDADGPVLPVDLPPEVSANPWAMQVAAASAAGMMVVAIGVLLANITPRSRLLRVARGLDGRTQLRSSSLLAALREDVRHSLEVTQVRTSLRGRITTPRISVWVVANSIDSPRELLGKLAAGPAARIRIATDEPRLPLVVYLQFPAGISRQERKRRTPVA